MTRHGAARWQRVLREICRPEHLRRTGLIALAVGAWLTLFNQGPQLLAGNVSGLVWLQIALNLATPFVVANLGLLVREPQAGEQSPRCTGGQGTSP